jgi:SAM-dependent methyltransferase
MVTEARDQIRSIQPGIPAKFDYAVLNAEAGPFRAGQFDGIIALGLLDHLPNRRKTLDEISRLLKPAGRFFASAGGSSHLQEIERLVRPFLPEVNFGGDPDRFGLENGAGLLAPWFADVHLLRYDNNLLFSRPEPVLAYILSEAQVRLSVDKDRWAALRRSVVDQLGSEGAIRVTTSKGLFIATKKNLA